MMKLFRKCRVCRIRSDQQGVSAVEFAIVLYPLIHIMIGIINFGFTFYAYNTIQNKMIETSQIYVGGGLTTNEAVHYIETEAEKFGGQFTASIDRSRPGSIELTLTGESAAFELVSFPYASLAQFRDEVTLRYRTSTYNTNPYTE